MEVIESPIALTTSQRRRLRRRRNRSSASVDKGDVENETGSEEFPQVSPESSPPQSPLHLSTMAMGVVVSPSPLPPAATTAIVEKDGTICRPQRRSRATRQSRSAVAKLREDLVDNDPDDALTIEDYFELGDAEFARVWKRSLRLLKKAFESNGGGETSASDSCCEIRRPGDGGLVFHAKVHRDILENEAIWFDFFLVDRGQYTESNPPFYDTAEQAIIILSTLADFKQPWGSMSVREEVHELLILAERLLERLQDLSQRYGDEERIYRTNHVAHTLMVQVLHFHSGSGGGGGRTAGRIHHGGTMASSASVCPAAVEAFRTCAELELADYSVGNTGERVTAWIPGRQRVTPAKLREIPDVKVWKWIIKHNRSSGSRRW